VRAFHAAGEPVAHRFGDHDMHVLPGEYVIVPGIGRCKVTAEYGNQKLTLESPSGAEFCMDCRDLVSSLWEDFERQVEQEAIGKTPT
jgi:hypothetical protein